MNDFLTLSKRDINVLDELIAKTEAAVKKAPPGTLRICRRSGHFYFYHRLPGSKEKAVYIPKDNIDLARALAQKDYDTKLLKNLYARRRALEKFQDIYPSETIESIYEGLSKERQNLVAPVILTDAQYVCAWLSKPYTGLAFSPDDSGSYITDNGERVRSKSEIIIANALSRTKIPYKYECPLTFSGRTIYPDFTLLDVKNRRVIYLEHCGRMDDPDYANDFVRKMNFYELNNIFPGKGLLLTFESSTQALNTAVLNLLIENFLL